MAVLQIFAGKKTGLKKNVVDGIDDWLGNPATPYIITDDFSPSEYGVASGTVITNTATGISTTINFIELDRFMILTTNIFSSVGDIYEIVVNENVSDVEYTELDLFDDETIELTQNIKDFKDISKVLTDYTQSFKIPASKTNNRYFEHYYNQDIVDGFDARFRYDCILKLNGADWKKGQIRLTDVDMKDGYADNYDITFYGNIVSLKTILGDDDLSILDYLDAFNHPLSFDNTKRYLSRGANLDYDVNGFPTGHTFLSRFPVFGTPDIIYPFISHENRYYIDGLDNQPNVSKSRNLYTPSGQEDEFHGLMYTDLKPSIKVICILRAIEWKYGISFSDDFFVDGDVFNWLYLHCSGESGNISKLLEEDSVDVGLEKFSYISGDGDKRIDSNTSLEWFREPGRGTGLFSYNFFSLSMNIIPDNTDGAYSVKVVDKNTEHVYYESGNVSDNFSFSCVLTESTYGSGVAKPIIRISTTGGISSFDVNNFSIENLIRDGGNILPNEYGYYSTYSSSSFSNLISFREKFLPKMKCIDLLTSLFKMFNLVAYVEDDVIVVKPLNQFYEEGSEIDITEYVDFSSYKVSRSDIYSEINYKYKEPKSVFSIKSNEVSNNDYGNESFNSNETTSFDGGKYDVKIDFSNVLNESMVSIEDKVDTGIVWIYSAGESFSPTVDTNLIHSYVAGQFGYVGSSSYLGKITDGVSWDLLPDGSSSLIFSPSSISWNGADSLNINFGSEVTNNTDADDVTLIKKYHEEYLLSIYNKSARRITIDSYIPISILLSMKLNDSLIINSKKYRINSMKNNLTNGNTKLELLSI